MLIYENSKFSVHELYCKLSTDAEKSYREYCLKEGFTNEEIDKSLKDSEERPSYAVEAKTKNAGEELLSHLKKDNSFLITKEMSVNSDASISYKTVDGLSKVVFVGRKQYQKYIEYIKGDKT
jgi:hypothetical protein